MNPGGGACSEPRWRHCAPACATERDSVSKKKKKRLSLVSKIRLKCGLPTNVCLERVRKAVERDGKVPNIPGLSLTLGKNVGCGSCHMELTGDRQIRCLLSL